jgi:hypothetical protein
MVDGHYACAAGTRGEVLRFKTAGEDGIEAGVCEAFVGSVKCVYGGIADSHAKALELCQWM